MKILFTQTAWKDLEWFLYKDKRLAKRISKERRLVYKIEEDTITVISCRFHYE